MKIVKPENLTAEVSRIEQVTDDIKLVWLKPLGPFEFCAGQFVNIKFPDPDDDSKIIQRAYSIASRPELPEFELCVEVIPNGKGSRYLDGLEVGDKVQMKAPFGQCTIKEDNKNDLVMVGTGTGIAPIKAILEDLATRRDSRRIDVWFGVRHESNLFYVDELSGLSDSLPGMNLHITLSQPEADDWDGLEGRVTAHLNDFDASHMPDFYICGGMSMIKDVMAIAKDKGVDRKKIHVEIFDV